MASTISLLPEKHFLCSLCREIFTNPVTIPCGHSFCLSCLSHYWSRHQSRYCPHCKRVFTDRPDLSINRILADVSDNYRKNRPQKIPEEELVIDVEQMVQERLQKIERLKNSLELQKNSYLREVRESQKIFSALVSAMEKSHKAVISAIEERQREEERKVERLVKELEQEIQELRKETTETEPQIPATGDQSEDTKQVTLNIVSTVCPAEMKDWSRVTIETDPCIGVTRRALSDVMEKIKAEVNRLSKSELKRIEKYTVDISLSAKTAHPFLSVSDDRKQVRHTDKLQEVPDNPKRFDRVANVLAKENFSSGRCYWEVEVGEKMEWNLGVVRQSINRKGRFTVCPANGFWTLSLRAGDNEAVKPRAFRVTPLYSGGTFDKNYNKRYQPIKFPVPLSTKKVELYAVITGHGSDENGCGEFCVTSHHFLINAVYNNTRIFDSAGTPLGCAMRVKEGAVPNEHGTWLYGRGGWCDGLQVNPWRIDITKQLDMSGSISNTAIYFGLFDGQDPNPSQQPGYIIMTSFLVFYK